MPISNHERVGKALEFLKSDMGPFVEREIKAAIEARRLDAHKLRDCADDPVPDPRSPAAAAWIWNESHFTVVLGTAE